MSTTSETTVETTFDLITLGRCGMDLFSQNIGAPFVAIQGFDAHIGGSPTNIAVAASRLGLRTALLTAVGADLVGDFVLAHLAAEGVATSYIPRKPGAKTGLAVVGMEPPDRFPLVFYRDNPADIWLNVDDVKAAPITTARALQLSGTALSRGSCQAATIYAAHQAAAAGVTTYVDLDLRPDQWADPMAFRAGLNELLPSIAVVIGTEEEFYALLGGAPETVFAGQRLDATQVRELDKAIAVWLAMRPECTLVLKRGAHGATIWRAGTAPLDVPGFPVTVLNTVGAGDAFAGGLLYGRCQGWDWRASVRMGNACGALVVTHHGCAAAMPRLEEVETFIKNCAIA
jgi:5-dehydro-2-deoxygluconokinase